LAQFQEDPHPPVVKADGLCAGKGVVVAETMAEAREVATKMLSGESFGSAGATVVLEERLLGAEASVHAICDGNRATVLPVAQDHKRMFDGDLGPNTGGMGTYAPAPLVTPEIERVIRTQVIDKVVSGMKSDGVPFVGALFVGLMIGPAGEPRVLEFNVRFGDPETQVLTLIVDGDFGDALYQAAKGELGEGILKTSNRHAMCVVLAAEGYPADVRKGDVISGLNDIELLPNVFVFHAGTSQKDRTVVTAGGRVLGVSASGDSLREAQERAYAAADGISFAGKQMRRDIGHRAFC
jgi:phosphoribosylamine--glycine ligase